MPAPVVTGPRLRPGSPSCSPPAGGAATASPSRDADAGVPGDVRLAADAKEFGGGIHGLLGQEHVAALNAYASNSDVDDHGRSPSALQRLLQEATSCLVPVG